MKIKHRFQGIMKTSLFLLSARWKVMNFKNIVYFPMHCLHYCQYDAEFIILVENKKLLNKSKEH